MMMMIKINCLSSEAGNYGDLDRRDRTVIRSIPSLENFRWSMRCVNGRVDTSTNCSFINVISALGDQIVLKSSPLTFDLSLLRKKRQLYCAKTKKKKKVL